jgi:hypothetical protein
VHDGFANPSRRGIARCHDRKQRHQEHQPDALEQRGDEGEYGGTMACARAKAAKSRTKPIACLANEPVTDLSPTPCAGSG